MSQISEEYKSIIEDVEKTIKNEEELEYVKTQINKITSLFMNHIDNILNLSDLRIKQMEERQLEIDNKVKQLTNMVNTIENELYVEDNSDNFDIICPYCNHEFSEDFNENQKEIQCPECKNIIELDWNDENDECSGHCSGCHGCNEDSDEENEEND